MRAKTGALATRSCCHSEKTGTFLPLAGFSSLVHDFLLVQESVQGEAKRGFFQKSPSRGVRQGFLKDPPNHIWARCALVETKAGPNYAANEQPQESTALRGFIEYMAHSLTPTRFLFEEKKRTPPQSQRVGGLSEARWPRTPPQSERKHAQHTAHSQTDLRRGLRRDPLEDVGGVGPGELQRRRLEEGMDRSAEG